MFDSIGICLLPLKSKAKNFLHRLLGRRPPKHGKWKPSSPSDVLLAVPAGDVAVSAQLRKVFDLIDSNGDGKISPSELGSVLSCLDGCGERAALDEARAMVREMDRDGDGLVDLDEFMGAVAEAADDRGDEDECLREAFLIYDKNGDGRISPEELRKVLAGLGMGKCSVKDCRSMIGGFDRDGDGFVDFEEFRSMLMPDNKP